MGPRNLPGVPLRLRLLVVAAALVVPASIALPRLDGALPEGPALSPLVVAGDASDVWALALDDATAERTGSGTLAAWRASGITAIVLDSSGEPSIAEQSAARRVRRAGLTVISPVRSASDCTLRPCAVVAPSTRAVAALTRSPKVDVVVVRFARVAAVASLRDLGAGQVLAVAPLRPPFELDGWRTALGVAAGNEHVQLAASLVSSRAPLDPFLRLLRAYRNDPAGVPVPRVDTSHPASLYVSPAGSDGGSCTRAAPCASFDRAYRVARPGDVVEVAAGTYPPQAIGVHEAKTSPDDVVFRPAPGASVVLSCQPPGKNCIAVEGRHVTVSGMRTADVEPLGGFPRQGGVCICRGSEDVTFVGLDAGYVYIAGDDAHVVGGDYGPSVDEVSKITTNTNAPRNVSIEGAVFHDYRRFESHMECLNVEAVDGLVIRNSRFDTCAVFGVIMKEEGPTQTMRNILIENNFFSNSGNVGMSAMISLTTGDSTCENVLVRYNTIRDDNVLSDCPATNVRWESNIFAEQLACETGSGATYDYNVVERGVRCGSHDAVAAAGGARYVDRSRLDLHVRGGSAAVDRGNRTDAPRRDIDGELRPLGRAPDAGADERR